MGSIGKDILTVWEVFRFDFIFEGALLKKAGISYSSFRKITKEE